ncbi:unnamed protein product [Urochloa decumbens]|uniref:F-box domain-containing protein n=1 Tax=Urochloa decumbens TaxID=240449 RepID=A0ABC8ZDI0_9POAL
MFDEMLRDADPVPETTASRRTAPAPPVEPCCAVNRINGIPRDVLLLILSRLESRDAVRTCVLSREWRDLWRDVPRILVSSPVFGVDVDGNCEEGNPLFKRFVNRLLMLRNPVPLDKFELCHYINSQFEADSTDDKLWIAHALLSKARAVDVYVGGYALEIGPEVFTSQYLTILRLSSCNFTPGFFGHLQTGCKALRRLVLYKCSIGDTEISSHTLELLAIGVGCVFTSDDRVSISIPSLRHLHLFGRTPGRIPLLENTESLRIAFVSVGWFEGIGIQAGDDIRRFLRGISGVAKLGFYFVQTELNMGKSLQWCPKFNNLRFLTLGEWCLGEDFYALIVFLQNSPKLKTLTLDLKKYIDVPGILRGELRERSFTCTCLKTVEIICSEGNLVVDGLEKFLIDSGIAPGKIRIRH